jgi:hypothetical protein
MFCRTTFSISSPKVWLPVASTTALALAAGLFMPACAATPFEDYLAYRTALASMTHESDLKAFYLDKYADKIPAVDTPERLAQLKMKLDQANLTKVSETINGDKATLVLDYSIGDKYTKEYVALLNKQRHATGNQAATVMPAPPERRRAVLTMQQEDGIWKETKTEYINVPTPTTATNAAARGAYKEAFPNKPLSGTIDGKQVTFNELILHKTTPPAVPLLALNFKDAGGKYPMTVDIQLWGQSNDLFTKDFVYKDDGAFLSPTLAVRVDSGQRVLKNFDTKTRGWGLRLRMMPPKDGKVPCYIIWRADNPTHDHLEGYFYAKIYAVNGNEK